MSSVVRSESDNGEESGRGKASALELTGEERWPPDGDYGLDNDDDDVVVVTGQKVAPLPAAVCSPAERLAFDVLNAKAQARLKARCKQYEVPDLMYAPADDTILAFRLPAVEAKTEAGIILPTHGVNRTDDGESADHAVMNVAMIVRAGCRALDWMRSHGILIGDLVKFGRFSGQEESCRWFVPDAGTVRPGFCKDMLQLDVGYILGSFDLAERLYGPNPSMKLVYAVDGEGVGLHIIKPIVKENA